MNFLALLAEDTGFKLPSPPATPDVLSWICVVLVLLLIYLVAIQAPKERKESRAEFVAALDSMMNRFEKVAGDARAEHAASLNGLTVKVDEHTKSFHDRMNTLQNTVASGGGCRASSG